MQTHPRQAVFIKRPQTVILRQFKVDDECRIYGDLLANSHQTGSVHNYTSYFRSLLGCVILFIFAIIIEFNVYYRCFDYEFEIGIIEQN